MRTVSYSLMVVILAFMLASTATEVRADSASEQEYRIKAAFMYNYIKFIDWPKEKVAGSNSITIGIIGKNPFGKAFEPLKNKRIKDKKVIIKQFKGIEESKLSEKQIEVIKKCYVLFVCRSEIKHLKEILKSVKGHSILTVGDMKDFLESGGVINLIMEDKKVRF